MISNNYVLEVLVNGRPVTEYHKNDRTFVEGRESSEYTLRFRNNSPKKVLAVLSVDGIEVLKAKVAEEADSGYIVKPYSLIEIKGYRIDNNTVAAFKFSDTNKSYSLEVGGETVNPVTHKSEYKKTKQNNGIIGVRVFEEKEKTVATTANWPFSAQFIASGAFLSGAFFHGITGNASTSSTSTSSYYLCSSNSLNTEDTYLDNQPIAMASICSSPLRARSFSSKPNFDLGSTWGGKLTDKIVEENFEKSEKYVDLEIYYASRESLVHYGIDFSNIKQIFDWPKAFGDKNKFCKIPEWYK